MKLAGKIVLVIAVGLQLMPAIAVQRVEQVVVVGQKCTRGWDCTYNVVVENDPINFGGANEAGRGTIPSENVRRRMEEAMSTAVCQKSGQSCSDYGQDVLAKCIEMFWPATQACGVIAHGMANTCHTGGIVPQCSKRQ